MKGGISMKEQWKFVNIEEVEPQSMLVSPEGKFMTPDNEYCDEYLSTNGFKYILLKLSKSERDKTGKKYRLFPSDDIIAKTFIAIPDHLKDDNYVEIIHKNGMSTDNSIVNLEWNSGEYRWANLDMWNIRSLYYQVSDRGEIRRISDKK